MSKTPANDELMAAIDKFKFETSQHTAKRILNALIENKCDFFEDNIFILDKVERFDAFLEWIKKEWDLVGIDIPRTTFLDNVLDSQRVAEDIARLNGWTI